MVQGFTGRSRGSSGETMLIATKQLKEGCI